MDYLVIRELYHHGIKDQKWGVRRYQYKDGTLTAEGRARYNKDVPEGTENLTKRGNEYYYKDAEGKEKLYKTNAGQLSDKELSDLNKRVDAENKYKKTVEDEYNKGSVTTALNDSTRVLDATARALPTGNGKYIKKDYSQLSDNELRNRINRLQLEESYGRLSGDTKYVKSGSEKAKDIIQTCGSIVAIGVSLGALLNTFGHMRENRLERKALKQSDICDNFLSHHGIKGQKWGVRRYQDEDGSLTADGKKRYLTSGISKRKLKKIIQNGGLDKIEREAYINSGAQVGGKKGRIYGMGIGALFGVGKASVDLIKGLKSGEKFDFEDTANSFVKKAIAGGTAGGLVGHTIGSGIGKRKYEEKLALTGKKYADDLLSMSIDKNRR